MIKSVQKPPITALVLLLFFLSGALGLTYEVVWSRMMMNIFGSTAIAVGTVLAAFMTGLAIGSWRFGKLADRSRNCLRLYAILEVGIALTALLSHVLLSWINPAHERLFSLIGSSAANFDLIRFLLAFLLVVLPTILMGATLPVLTRYLVDRPLKIGVNLSTLYASNTFGAVTGVLLTGFFLIGRYGIHVPVYGAVVGNLLVGAVAWLLSFRAGASSSGWQTLSSDAPSHELPDAGVMPGPVMMRLILVGLGLSGFTSFAYEIYWTRSLVFVLGNSTYALTTMLSAFLTGIALGGFLIRFALARFRDGSVIFGWIQVLLGLFSALALPLLFSISDPQTMSQYLIETSGQVAPFLFAGFGVAFLVMLVPAMLIGATFPVAGQILVRDRDQAGASVGRVYAVNTVGNVLGALLPGFFLLNWLGIQKGILAMAVINTALGFVILFARLLPASRSPAWRVALPLLLVLTVFTLGRAPLQFQFPSEGEFSHHRTLYYREGPTATTKVFLDPVSNEKHMSVDGIIIGGTGMAEFKQLLLAHLPKLLLPDAANELSVGVGSGILMGESMRHPGMKKITGVEIEPGVIEGAAAFAAENDDVLNSPDLTVVVDDIGNFLRTSSERYQVITADEKTADEYASNGFSYSLEYYSLLRDHLTENGIVAQWIPSTLPLAQYQMVLRTFTESFPNVQLWYFLPAHRRGPFNSILIGSNQRVPISHPHIDRQFNENPDAYQSLQPYGLTSAEALLPHFVADERTLRKAMSSAHVNSLEHPRYEFYYPWDYAAAKQSNFVANHRLMMELKREASAGFLQALQDEVPDLERFKKTLLAENLFLTGFERYLTGLTSMEMYRMFDYLLALAPWNDSMRARIYALYAYTASTRRDPAERARLSRKAEALYDGRDNTGSE